MSRTIVEWAINFIILIFATSTIAQPFVIPTASMESTLMTGDHMIVDKLAFSPPGPLTRGLLPYEDVKRGDIIVFRYPIDVSQTWVKRAIGAPGDRHPYPQRSGLPQRPAADRALRAAHLPANGSVS